MNLFYSKSENLAFYIPDYYMDSNSNVVEFIDNLRAEACVLSALVPGTSLLNIRSQEITSSSRYKNMRVFWVGAVKCPKGAFELGDDWTMWKWITN